MSTPFRTLADFEHELPELEWAWPGRVPYGYLTLIAGDPSIGKSALCLDIAARMLEGATWPDGTKPPRPVQHVLWIDTEGTTALLDTRVRARGADASKFMLVTDGLYDDVHLDRGRGAARLSEFAEQHPGDLIVVDSLRGSHAGDENDSAMTEFLKQLQLVATKGRSPMLVTHHLRKPPADMPARQGVTLTDLRGSTAIGAMFRVIHTLDAPEGDSEPRRLHMMKNNMGPQFDDLWLSITSGGVDWTEAPLRRDPRSQLERGMDLLVSLGASHGDQPAVGIIEAAAREERISMDTMERAKTDLGWKSVKDGHGGWSWQERPFLE